MVKIPYIKIPGVRVGSIGPASNIGTGGATPAPPSPSPITYLTQWQIVGNSEVHTLPYPDGVVLPNGYKRCKYLKFHGTEYFNSGIKSSDTIGVKINFTTNNANVLLLGCRKDMSNDSFAIGYFTLNGTGFIGYGGATSQVHLKNSSFIDDGVTHNIQLDSVNAKIDGENFVEMLNRGTFTSYYDIYIGTWNNNGIADSRMFIGKMYAIEIYDSTQTLGNFIPCLDDNDVPCLYDTISGTTLYNQGTGTCDYEIEPQPAEIWSCGEYNATDGKYHILVQSLGGSIADIALDEPLRKVNNVADSIEFPSDTEGKALVTIRVEENGGELSPLVTPTTELVDAPQIEEAESYTCVISQGGKAVSWSSFETDSE